MRYILGFICCTIVSLSASATGLTEERRHNLGVSLGSGAADTLEEFGTDGGIVSLGGYYEYKINHRYDFNFTALNAGSVCFITCTGSGPGSIHLTSYQLTAKALTDFDGDWNLFGRAGADIYRVTYSPRAYGEVTKSVSDVNAVVAVGAQLRRQGGFSLTFEYQYLPVRQGNFKIISTSVGYAF